VTVWGSRFFFVLLSLALAGVASGKEATRTLRAELSGGDSAQFSAENLAGAMRVVPGSGAVVEVVATIHARIPELAALVRIDRGRGDDGFPVLRVHYPLDLHTSYRYPGVEIDGALLLGLLPGNPVRAEYDGRGVVVSDRKGALLYVDIEVRLPSRTSAARFRSVVGPMEGRGLSGTFRFETGYGAVTLAKIRGDALADTGSGDVSARDMAGSFKCDVGKGNCIVDGFAGESLVCDTNSGRVDVTRATARSLAVDTSAGDVRLGDVDATDIKVDTGSGSLDLTSASRRLARLRAVTGSGAVRLRLSPDAEFEAHAGLGSGRIHNHYADADPIVRKRAIVGYRRGGGRIRIDVQMGSGSLTLEPAR
jgi:hypothetical protein